jgi:hypothetical protein
MVDIKNKDLPSLFFIPKYQSLNGYCLQLIEFKHTIQSVNYFPSERVSLSHTQDISSNELFHCPLIEENYWYLPYQIENIPIIDFQYLSWIPSYYKPISIINNSEMIFNEFFEIRHLNLIQLQRSKTPPRPQSYDTYSPPPIPSRSQTILHNPPKPIRIKEGCPLPAHVIEALLRDAKVGKECCPISMTSYSECNSLTITSCFHIFETKSIEEWFKTKRNCPVCRTESKIIA